MIVPISKLLSRIVALVLRQMELRVLVVQRLFGLRDAERLVDRIERVVARVGPRPVDRELLEALGSRRGLRGVGLGGVGQRRQRRILWLF